MSSHNYYAPNSHYPVTTPYRSTSFAITPHKSSSSRRDKDHHYRSSGGSRKKNHDSGHYYPQGYPAVIYNAPGSTLVYGSPGYPPNTHHYPTTAPHPPPPPPCCAPQHPPPPPPPPAYPNIAACRQCNDIRELRYGLCRYCNDYSHAAAQAAAAGGYPAPPYGSTGPPPPAGQYYPGHGYSHYRPGRSSGGGGYAYPLQRRRTVTGYIR